VKAVINLVGWAGAGGSTMWNSGQATFGKMPQQQRFRVFIN
jgi:hypothetical protein